MVDAFAAVRPDAVVNAVGLVGRRAEGREEDVPDPVDVHGMTRLLGEVRNRALSARRLWPVTGYRPPGWPAMVDELATAMERRDSKAPPRLPPAPRPDAIGSPRAALTSPNGVHADA
ncbi:hypothetical protein MXD62_13550 [Frankia sp. Mgl5]|nr:hypothetical protein [Frankia sp. Mgl5]